MMLFIIISLWRIVYFGIAALTSRIFSFTPRFPYSDVYLVNSNLPQWVWTWANFDGVHYLTIAKYGYSAQFTQAFFPLYPLILGFGELVNKEWNFIVTGLLISFTAFFLGVFLFRKLLAKDYHRVVVQRSLWFLLIFPTSFYFAALYTESLFFLLVMGALLFAREKRWWLSSIFGAAATATRVTGIFLLPALLWEFYDSRKSDLSFRENLKKLIFSPILYLVPLGLLSYMVYLQRIFSDALYFFHAQSVFGAERSGGKLVFPLQTIARYAKILLTVPVSQSGFWIAVWELSALLFGIVLLIMAHKRRVRRSYLLFSWGVLILPIVTGTLSSFPRYLLLIFPTYIVMGMMKNQKLIFLVSFILLGLLIWATSTFLRGMWIA